MMQDNSSTPPQEIDDMQAQHQTRNADQQPKMIMPLRWRWPESPANQIIAAPSYLQLSKGWRFESRPRTSEKYEGKVDKLYYEPGTGRKFRSLKAAQEADRKRLEERNLNENEQQTPPNALNLEDDAEGSRSPESGSRNGPKKRMRIPNLNFGSPPEKVKRIITDAHGKDEWSSTSVDETMVPDSLKNQNQNQWAETFVPATDANVDASK